jgi:predicted DNA-binding transcriptional regulator YafY
MSRSARLLQLLDTLRRARQPQTGPELAQALGISLRTLYRDIATLRTQGADILGDPGIGFEMRPGFLLPPLMFSADELAALRLGMAMVSTWGDPALAELAANAQAKINAVLPPSAARQPAAQLFVPDLHDYPVARLTPLRRAIAARQYVELDYCRADGALSRRRVRPLGLFFWGVSWTLAAWCEARDEFRNFRIDRMLACTPLADTFTPQAGRTLEDFFRAVGASQPPAGG